MQPSDREKDQKRKKKQGEQSASESPPNPHRTPEKHKTVEHLSTTKSNNKFLSYLIEGPPLKLATETKNKFNGCNCRKTQCLKMYCICFSSGKMCGQGCLCESCQNKTDNPMRAEAINQIISKDPFAFSRGDANVSEYSGEGCNCKKSNCSKKYCVCYSKKRKCGKECRCLGCENPFKEELSNSPDEILKKKMKVQ